MSYSRVILLFCFWSLFVTAVRRRHATESSNHKKIMEEEIEVDNAVYYWRLIESVVNFRNFLVVLIVSLFCSLTCIPLVLLKPIIETPKNPIEPTVSSTIIVSELEKQLKFQSNSIKSLHQSRNDETRRVIDLQRNIQDLVSSMTIIRDNASKDSVKQEAIEADVSVPGWVDDLNVEIARLRDKVDELKSFERYLDSIARMSDNLVSYSLSVNHKKVQSNKLSQLISAEEIQTIVCATSPKNGIDELIGAKCLNSKFVDSVNARVNDAISSTIESVSIQRDLANAKKSLEHAEKAKLAPTMDDEQRIPTEDYALFIAGARVIETLTTSTFTTQTFRQSINKVVPEIVSDAIPSFSDQHLQQWLHLRPNVGSPIDAISSETNLGSCWPMKGHNGTLAVQLADSVVVESITIDHVSKEFADNLDSAPREFEVYGKKAEFDVEELIVKDKYKIDGKSAQNFIVNPKVNVPFSILILKILGNYGNPNFTCLYRFRVHGRRN